ncbi:hypothetical protein GZ78_23195 [Endozoicomonas numazuensis]|uniref:Uncharacterized protein n=1 Tax=Endozoicomonas numazuensis TaxID=1137799 RepID=A0A081NCI7_9GAMM|nr:hypothetical protein GZ78_23195 [Endozoicomonas numazuensis]
MDAGARATQEQLPVGQTILGQPPRVRLLLSYPTHRIILLIFGKRTVIQNLFLKIIFCYQVVMLPALVLIQRFLFGRRG